MAEKGYKENLVEEKSAEAVVEIPKSLELDSIEVKELLFAGRRKPKQ